MLAIGPLHPQNVRCGEIAALAHVVGWDEWHYCAIAVAGECIRSVVHDAADVIGQILRVGCGHIVLHKIPIGSADDVLVIDGDVAIAIDAGVLMEEAEGVHYLMHYGPWRGCAARLL